MKTPILFVILLSAIGHMAAHAQEPAVDLSGVYAPPVFVATISVFGPDEYPFTEQGERAFNAYDPLVASPNQADDCTPDLMPGILWANSPMEIVQEAERVVIRYERGNTVRSIPTDGSPAEPHPELGTSVGHWDGDVLTIETTHMTSDVIRNNRGHPLSPEARVTERYWREPGTNDLEMELTVDDPTNYTETFVVGRKWVWAPDEELQEYECVNLGPRGEEPPDIDELTRMLEQL